MYKQVYQFKITLEKIKPLIWRQIQVPENYSFWDLHVAIQDSMGWQDCHLHQFVVLEPGSREKRIIGIPADGMNKNLLLDWNQKIADYFSLETPRAEYIYDIGDYWKHSIKLEKIAQKIPGIKYPVCLAGKRACPPEDCGGPGGYEELLEAIKDPRHEEHDELLEWVGEDFDPESFSHSKVKFVNPKKRLESALEYFQ